MWFLAALLAIDAITMLHNGFIMGSALFAGFYAPVIIMGKIIFDFTVENT